MFTQETIRGVLVLTLLGVALGIGYNFASTKQVPWKRAERKVERIEDPAPATRLTEPPTGDEFPGGTNGQDVPPPAGKGTYDDLDESEFPREISLARAKSFYDRGGLLVLDARDRTEYAMGHIKGAVFTPHDEKVADVAWLDEMARKPNPILIYCDGGDCELSLNLGFAIAESGHRKVMVLTEGYPAWEDAGYPTATGDLP